LWPCVETFLKTNPESRTPVALIECSECGREISDKAAACPGCGAPVEKATQATEPDDPNIVEAALGRVQ
jgi:predicted amidophosphoribosyltransferase